MMRTDELRRFALLDSGLKMRPNAVTLPAVFGNGGGGISGAATSHCHLSLSELGAHAAAELMLWVVSGSMGTEWCPKAFPAVCATQTAAHPLLAVDQGCRLRHFVALKPQRVP